MTNEKHLIYSAVFGLLIKNNEILLIRRFNTGYKDGFLTLPTGHIEKDELPKEAMLRELKEETGLICNLESIIPIHVMHRICDSGRTYVDYFFKIEDFFGEPSNMEPEKCDLIGWYNKNSIPKNTLPSVKIAVDFINKNVFISEVRES